MVNHGIFNREGSMLRNIRLAVLSAVFIAGSAAGLVVTERPAAVMMTDETGIRSGQSEKNGYPDPDSIMIVCTDIDYGSEANGPTSYAAQRHIAFGRDTYHVVWEWGLSRDNNVSHSYWESFGSIGYWTWPDYMNGWGIDCGRPSIVAGNDGRMIASWHQTNGSGYNIYTGYNDGDHWYPRAATDTTDTIAETFAALARSADGRIWLGYDEYNPGVGDYIRVRYSEDNGETWSDAEQVSPFPVAGGWVQCALAADPSNGDVWLAYHDSTGGPGDGGTDIVVHRYDSATETWGTRQILDEGYSGAQSCLPSIVVDTNHDVHVAFAVNQNPTLQGLYVYRHTGPFGPIKYVYGYEDDWSAPQLVTGGTPTDSTSGMPSLGIDPANNLYLVFTQIDSSDGNYFFNTFNSYMTTRTPAGDWSGRIDLSELGAISFADSFHCIYPHVTQEAPGAGPGVTWAQMIDHSPPSTMLFTRMECLPGQPGPSILHDPENLEFELAKRSEKTAVITIGNIGNRDLIFDLMNYEEWLTIGDYIGNVPPDSEEEVQITVRSHRLALGEHNDTIVVTSNDSLHPLIEIPVIMTVTVAGSVWIDCDPYIGRGEMLHFDYGITNLTQEAITFEIWLSVTMPDGEPAPIEPIAGPIPLTLGPGALVEGESELEVPMPAPPGGPYTLHIRAGIYPLIILKDGAEFTILPFMED